MTPSSDRKYRIATIAILSLSIFVAYIRLFFGVDFTDEGFYAALPLSFLRGHQPFQHEQATQQLSALLSLPLVATYNRLAPSNEGIILFFRHIYFAISLTAGLTVRRYFRKAGTANADLLIALPLLFFPFGLPQISYNTQAVFGLIAALFLDGPYEKSGIPAFFAGILLALASFAYPPIALIAVLYAAARILRSFSKTYSSDLRQRRNVAFLLAGGLVAGAVLFSVVAHYGIGSMMRVFAASEKAGIQGGGTSKLLSISAGFAHLVNESITWNMIPLGLILVLLARYGERFKPGLKKLATPKWMWLALVLMLWSYVLVESSLDWASHFLVLSPFIAMAIAAIPSECKTAIPGDLSFDLKLKIVISMAAGFVFSFASANGFWNVGLGFVVGSIAACGWLLVVGSRKGGTARAMAFVIVSACVILLLSLHRTVYRDDSLNKLTHVVEEGPYKFLRTTPEKGEFLSRLQADLREQVDNHTGTILIYDNFPAGYLLTQLKPMTTAIWLVPRQHYPGLDRRMYIEFHQPIERQPDYVLEMGVMPVSSTEKYDFSEAEGDPFRHYFQTQGYRTLLSRPGYSLLVHPDKKHQVPGVD